MTAARRRARRLGRRGRWTSAALALALGLGIAGCSGADEAAQSSTSSGGALASAVAEANQPSTSSGGAVASAVAEANQPSTSSGGSVAEAPTSPRSAASGRDDLAASPKPATGAPVAPDGDFCDAVAALNDLPESDDLAPAERERALKIVDELLRLWPAETKDAAEAYFGEIRKALEAGSAVDLDNSTEAFKEAFGIVFEYAADVCPGGFG